MFLDSEKLQRMARQHEKLAGEIVIPEDENLWQIMFDPNTATKTYNIIIASSLRIASGQNPIDVIVDQICS